MTAARPTYYWDYIEVDRLLGLQGGLDGDDSQLENEEVLFITVHQVFELWFKIVLRELIAIRNRFKAEILTNEDMIDVVTRLERCATILRVGNQHWEVMETLPPRAYLKFRSKLMPASGFQSAQLRQIEILLGLEESERIPFGTEGSHLAALRGQGGVETEASRRVAKQLEDLPSLKDAVAGWLERTPIGGAHHHASSHREFVEQYLAAHSRDLDANLAHAQTVASKGADGGRLKALYDRERQSVRDFLLPDDERLGRIRAAILFIETYPEEPLLTWPHRVLEGILGFEQLFVIFRQRHARMVERIIGRRTGTGGTAGVDYLDQTALKYRIFPELWAVRSMLINPQIAPALEGAAFFGLRAESGG
ncbi:MAG: tryptophan 2,3-dioxygenase [Planctomycetes bacterium]|nr:tryptophan 2,3-dioxygenase [Planctomycetota bacterium]MCB9909891.1 tryptophan 2,3-dioxygenase [Planctomycetota bacterium]HPF15340.1 tryptophan 2,3-dioxygenase family protein [Planctomycetota bacterium]